MHVFVKGAGQPGVQSEWVGTTWFRRLVQKDSCFELGQVRYVLQSPQKCSCVDTERKQKKLIGTVSVRMFDVCATKLHISHEPCVRRHRFCMTTMSPTLNISAFVPLNIILNNILHALCNHGENLSENPSSCTYLKDSRSGVHYSC